MFKETILKLYLLWHGKPESGILLGVWTDRTALVKFIQEDIPFNKDGSLHQVEIPVINCLRRSELDSKRYFTIFSKEDLEGVP
jgi:hypothetical protein